MNIDKVKLRVFHRTKTDISLLWSTACLNADQRNNARVLCEGKPLQVTIEASDGKDDVAKDTAICFVDHELNGLKPDAKYVLTVVLGGESSEPVIRKIAVLEYGVLPPFDRDKKSARVHLMGWDDEAGTWVKMPVVRTKDGGYAIPMVQVEPRTKA
jgi:hypothetical protein